jgi:hypothetical protein
MRRCRVKSVIETVVNRGRRTRNSGPRAKRLQKMNSATKYNEKFLKFIEAFMEIGTHTKIFPKKCSTCGRVFASFPEYIHGTEPLGHGLEPYKDSVDVLHTMQYRNCRCGTTLALRLTRADYPLLESFWEMIGKESKERNRPVREIVLEFREQCNLYIHEHEPALK